MRVLSPEGEDAREGWRVRDDGLSGGDEIYAVLVIEFTNRSPLFCSRSLDGKILVRVIMWVPKRTLRAPEDKGRREVLLVFVRDRGR